jgi:hypothetical protein
MREVDINELIKDYNNGYGIYDICEKYKIGKIRAKDILKANDIILRKRGRKPLNEDEFVVKDFKVKKYEEHEGFHYIAKDKLNGFETKDYMNRGGNLTSHIEREYGIVAPTLYDRRMYYMRTGDYWWEQWFDIIEVKDIEKKKCPYCDWETSDIENKSGAFCVHVFKEHGMTKLQYLKEHPEDRKFFAMANSTADLQLETNEDKFVTCRICGKKLTRITDVHLQKHGMTKLEYMDKFGLSGTTCNNLHDKLSKIAIETNMEMVREFSSSQEREIKEYIKSLGFECHTDRKILHGKELDIFIPEKNIAIEYNGNVWHSEKYKTKDYHLNKLNECNRNGVRLIQIFEDEYQEHKDIVLSKIRHILGSETQDAIKIQGRKCKVKEITNTEAEKFLNANHIQGFANSTIYLGAKLNNEIVAVMSFLIESKDNWNLTRFASKNGTICQGVASKMFSYFIKAYNPATVKSFADRRWTLQGNNNLYTKLGFKLADTLGPEYRYFNSSVDRFKRFHKFNFRKQILHKKYGLPLEMTELEMATKLGYIRIWDCGLFKYVYKKEE